MRLCCVVQRPNNVGLIPQLITVITLIIIINYLLLIICVRWSGFVTLLECKILGDIQIRIGSNKVGFIGLIQPFADAGKVFSKEKKLQDSNIYIMFFLKSKCPKSMELLSEDGGVLFIVLYLYKTEIFEIGICSTELPSYIYRLSQLIGRNHFVHRVGNHHV
ncbi:NADH-ubiquinone oxidoreductase chain 1-like [Penaeus indicus]|uniref:NADH-ubiquinone oxidoreductase chain 1-like n=1 Tax=Penaeus indicus TaxID=29960 RepID=UPI00300D04DD